jgi:hypothetical protein
VTTFATFSTFAAPIRGVTPIAVAQFRFDEMISWLGWHARS